jgi:hypothetical protein
MERAEIFLVDENWAEDPILHTEPHTYKQSCSRYTVKNTALILDKLFNKSNH